MERQTNRQTKYVQMKFLNRQTNRPT